MYETSETPGATIADSGRSKGLSEFRQSIAGYRQHTIHRRLHFELPIPAVGLQAEESDVGDIDSVFAVDVDESEGLKQWHDHADRPDGDERCT